MKNKRTVKSNPQWDFQSYLGSLEEGKDDWVEFSSPDREWAIAVWDNLYSRNKSREESFDLSLFQYNQYWKIVNKITVTKLTKSEKDKLIEEIQNVKNSEKIKTINQYKKTKPVINPRVNMKEENTIKFNKYHVLNTETKQKAKVLYCINTDLKGEKYIALYGRNYSSDLTKIFPKAINNSDSMVDYAENDSVKFYKGDPLYEAAYLAAKRPQSRIPKVGK